MLPFLVDIFIHLQDRTKHIYVEVILRQPPKGTKEGEGRFLEDSRAPHKEVLIENVLKLG